MRTRAPLLTCALLCLAANPYAKPPAPLLSPSKEADTTAGAVLLATPIEGMVLEQAGSFSMGSDAPEQKAAVEMCKQEVLGPFCADEQFVLEGLPHLVTLPAFWIDRTEVTVAAYRRCVDVGGCALPGITAGDPKHDRPELPVTFVTWDDAKKFCAWRGARLPTEAEWERAARGVQGRRFPWGMLPNPHLANHGAFDVGSSFFTLAGVKLFLLGVPDDDDGYAGLAPVASFPDGKTPDGLYDLAGNVAEWVADAWDGTGYAATPVTSPTGPASGSLHMIRGGSFKQPMPMVRGASRFPRLGSTRDADVGFRCAKDG